MSGNLVDHALEVLATLLGMGRTAAQVGLAEAAQQRQVGLPQRGEGVQEPLRRGTGKQRPSLLVIPGVGRGCPR